MIDHPTIFATINIACSAIGIFGGILGISSYLYMKKNKEFVEFLVEHFSNAVKRRYQNGRNRKRQQDSIT